MLLTVCLHDTECQWFETNLADNATSPNVCSRYETISHVPAIYQWEYKTT